MKNKLRAKGLNMSFKLNGELVEEEMVNEVLGQLAGGVAGTVLAPKLAKVGIKNAIAQKAIGGAAGAAAGEVLDPFKKGKDKNPVAAAVGGAAGGAIAGGGIGAAKKAIMKNSHELDGKVVEGYKGTMDMSKSHPDAVKKVEKNIEKGLGKRVPGGKMGAMKSEEVNPTVQSALDSLNSIVKKNFNLGEEGYDIARDMGRVKPSKDKKDGTTMPPSAEMKKTQKINKGPSAAEIVKKKYGKAVMNLGKK